MGSDLRDVNNELGYDPFYDSIGEIEGILASNIIGYAYIYLDTIYYLMNIEEDFIPIIDDKGAKKGALKLSIMSEIPGVDLEEHDNLKDIIGKDLAIEISIKEAIDIPEKFANGTYCTYELPFLGEVPYETNKVDDFNTNPIFSYK
jgi:hypothetical protein